MNIEKDKWVAIHYTLKDDDGKEIDSSVGGAPLGYVHGRGYLIPGLENELEGKTTGKRHALRFRYRYRGAGTVDRIREGA